MKVAVVILNFNGKQLLEKFLPSVIQYSAKQAKIYVIDNNSTDDSLKFLNQTYSQHVEVIALPENYGFAGGYNRGLTHVNEELLCLLNSDVEVTPNWLDPLIEAFNNDSDLGIAQPKILNEIHRNQFDYAGAAGGYIDKYGFPYCRGRIFNTLEEDRNQYDQTTETFWASGACFFITKKCYEALQGFDEDFFAHMEEVDLCWRAFHRDIKVRCIPKSVVYHVGGATLSYGSSKKTYLNFRNSLLMLTKNLPKNKVIGTVFVRMILDGLAALHFLIQGKPAHFFAVLKAHISFYTRVSATLSKRNVQNSKQNYFNVSSIVWSYFVAKKKVFSRL